MIGKLYILLSVLQAEGSQEWKANTPRDMKVLRGLCAHILCLYSHPERLANQSRVGVWHVQQSTLPVAFHSEDNSRISPRFRHRTRLSGDLRHGDCSLVISNVTQEDEGSYYFRIEFKEPDQYNYFPVTQLHVAPASENWRADTPRDVTAQRGLCARVPCRYSYPPNLDKAARVGIWVRDECTDRPVAFHSGNPDGASPRFRNRTRLSGHLEDGNCSLVIDDIVPEDEGHYYFRIEFKSPNRYSYVPTTQLHVTDFTDKPSIFPAEMVAGKPVNVSCTFNTTCDGTEPNLTWVTPADVPPSVSSSVTQRGDTLTYTSVLTLTPELKHHGQNLTCRVTYPSVSSERTLTLTVQYAPQSLSITVSNKVDISWVSVHEGDSAAILCSVRSVPASNLTWRHLGDTLTTTSSTNKLWLEFPRVTAQLAGVYQCAAENGHGRAEGNVTLSVERQSRIGIPLTAAAVVVFLIISSALVGLIVTTRWRTDRPPRDASRPAPEEDSGMGSGGKRQKQEKAERGAESKRNTGRDRGQRVYQNVHFEDRIYEKM